MSSQIREHRRSSIMEYEQSVLFGQYHEKLASFARLQSSRVKDQRARLRERKKNFVTRFILPFFMTIGNWPLLFFLGILISFASFLVDVATHALISSEFYIRFFSLFSSREKASSSRSTFCWTRFVHAVH